MLKVDNQLWIAIFEGKLLVLARLYSQYEILSQSAVLDYFSPNNVMFNSKFSHYKDPIYLSPLDWFLQAQNIVLYLSQWQGEWRQFSKILYTSSLLNNPVIKYNSFLKESPK